MAFRIMNEHEVGITLSCAFLTEIHGSLHGLVRQLAFRATERASVLRHTADEVAAVVEAGNS